MPRYFPEPFTGEMVSAAWLLPLLAFLALSTHLMAEDKDDVDHVAAAKAALQSLHDACDEWAQAQAKGKETLPATEKIWRSYLSFLKHIRKTEYLCNAAFFDLRPENIRGAGKLKRRDGSAYSYVLVGELGMSLFTREK